MEIRQLYSTCVYVSEYLGLMNLSVCMYTYPRVWSLTSVSVIDFNTSHGRLMGIRKGEWGGSGGGGWRAKEPWIWWTERESETNRQQNKETEQIIPDRKCVSSGSSLKQDTEKVKYTDFSLIVLSSLEWKQAKKKKNGSRRSLQAEKRCYAALCWTIKVNIWLRLY